MPLLMYLIYCCFLGELSDFDSILTLAKGALTVVQHGRHSEKHVCLAGCKFSLQFRGASGYSAMTYHLVQASDTPVVIKDQAWYLSQLEAVMEEHYSCGQSRAFYMFEHRFA